MNVFLIIILTILVTAIASVEFRVDHNKSAIKSLGATGKKAKAVAKFIDIYPGFELFINLISLLAMIWIACLCAITWGIWAGCFIALVVIALAHLLGARLVALTDQFIIAQAGLLVKYFGWTGVLNSLVVKRSAEPVEDTDELIEILRSSRIDCPTQLAIEKIIQLRSLTVDKLATKWADIHKIGYREKLTPKTIDELFQSQQKIFPVIRNDENDVVGLLHFMDISTIGQTEKNLINSMHRNFVTCEHDTTITAVLQLMAENETTVAVVMKNKKVYGMVNLTDILAHEPVCPTTTDAVSH